LFKPDTGLKWQRELVRRKWTFCSTQKRGRPKTLPERESLVVRLASENVPWGTDRIHGELLKLGLRIGATPIRAILHRHGVLPAPQRRANGGSWGKLLRHDQDQLLACDFLRLKLPGSRAFTSGT
jgi:transposase